VCDLTIKDTFTRAHDAVITMLKVKDTACQHAIAFCTNPLASPSAQSFAFVALGCFVAVNCAAATMS
jgi:hypothetical protein